MEIVCAPVNSSVMIVSVQVNQEREEKIEKSQDGEHQVQEKNCNEDDEEED